MKLWCAVLIVLTVSTPLAAKSKGPGWDGGIVTSWDGARIHYIEAGHRTTAEKSDRKIPDSLFRYCLCQATRCPPGNGRNRLHTSPQIIA